MKVNIHLTFDTDNESLDQALAALTLKHKSEAAPASAKAPAPAPTPATAPVAKAEPENVPAPDDIPDEAAVIGSGTVTKTDVRAVATALSKSGKRAELQAIFKELGGSKLSDIKEADYPALMEKLVAANA